MIIGFIGSGSMAATGGAGGEAGGGGGRIALYFSTNNGFNLAQATAAGGSSGSGSPGAVGTVYTLGAGSNLTVSDNTMLPANSTLNYSSVTVNNAGTLTLGSGSTLTSNTVTVSGGGKFTVGGGSSVTVSGALLLTTNSRMVLQSINNAAQVNGTWQGSGVTLNAGSVQVDSGSSLNADGEGYLANAGPGGAPGGSSAGGSYGGPGGVGAGVSPEAIYGSDTMPTDLGSGGGSRCCQAVAGPGGGAIRLIVSGTLTDNGVISANGADLVGYQGGGGAGGSLWVTTAGLAGSGIFTANGGRGGEAAGGGGRIAVYYNAPTSSFTGFEASTSNGASCGTQCSNGTSSAGGTGTAAFFDTSATNTNLMVDQDLAISPGTTVRYNSITVQPGAVLTIGGGSTVTVANLLTVSGTVVAQSINNSALVNNMWQGAGVILNAAAVMVNANGSINADGQGYVANAGPGGAPTSSSAGGSYGGPGGVGNGVSAGAVFGSTTTPTDLGSGGGSRCCSALAGAGGGALTFNVSGTFTNNGVVSANGGAVVGYQAGGGAGGSLYLRTASLTGSGAFTAMGGVGGEAGGGGGRVAIYYDAPSSTFTGFAASTATGGACGVSTGSFCSDPVTSVGSNGTAAFFDTSVPNNKVSIYQNFTIPVGTSPTYNALTVNSGALLTIGGGAAVTVTNALTVSGTVVAQSANNTALVNGIWVGAGVAINAASLTVTASGSLNTDTQGYVAGAGPGGARPDTSAGGSYGGLGGVGAEASAAPTYGSLMEPTDLGSGGNTRCCGTAPGAGGGALLLTVSGALTDDGIISSNGGDGTGLQVGGGSGGSVSIHTTILAGSGHIAANGGLGGEAGGGGGRIALYFQINSFNITQATAAGGSSGEGNAGTVGTVYIPTPAVLSTTTLNVSPTPLTVGRTATLQAFVTSAVAPTTPTGMVIFKDGTALIGMETLTASPQIGTAMAQFQTASLGVGSHSITASYGGDGAVVMSASAPQTILVSPAAPTTTLAVSAVSITAAQPETLTATVTGLTSPAITGNVTFLDGTTSLGNRTLMVTGGTGSATLIVPSLALGTHIITAHYNSDGNYAASTSGAQSITVIGTQQTITFPVIPNRVYGDPPFSLGATASSGLAVNYSVVSGPATVSGARLTLTGSGTVSIEAMQAGNTTYAAATPVSQTFMVSAAPPTLAGISPSIGIVGSGATTITLTGTNFASTDTVRLNGAGVTTMLVNATTLRAVLPASFFAVAGPGLVTVADSASGKVTATATFTVEAAPQFALSGPSTATSGEQPALTFTLTNPYPFPLAGSLTLTFAPVASAGVSDDPTVQFSGGGRTIDFNIPADSTATPSVQLQTGTIAGSASVTLTVTSGGESVTPADVVPVVITIPAAVPSVMSAKTIKNGKTLTVALVGFSNTREVTKAVFHFTPVVGSSIENPDVSVDVSNVFAGWYGSATSDAYGSTFTYTQPFTLDADATSIASVTITLQNAVGVSVISPAR